MAASPVPHISPEEYLALDRAAEFKSEYFDGRMYAMSGGSDKHSSIAPNVIVALGVALRESSCRLRSDMRLQISPSGYTYPDLMVVCGEAKLADGRSDTLLNPTVVVEVLSDSTEAYDRGFKFAQYRRVESVREYVLVSQSAPMVEIFRRQPDGEFKLSEYEGLDAVCRFDSLHCTIPMSEIYLGIEFAA